MVSIIIPFYNRKEYVRVMVDSIIAQKYKDWELIMVDDGSSDGSFEMLEEYHKIDSRILLFHRDSNLKGANVCRNIGLRVSHGEYVIFLDSDDWIPDYCLENRVMFMEKNRNLDFAVFPGIQYGGAVFNNGNHLFGVSVFSRDFPLFIMRNLPFTVVNNIYRRDSLERNARFWDEKLSSLQDADFNIQNICCGMKYAYAEGEKPDYFVRIIGNNGSVSKVARTSKHSESHFYYLEKLSKTLNGKYPFFFFLCVESILLLIGPNAANIKEYRHFFVGRVNYWRIFATKAFIYKFLSRLSPNSNRIISYFSFPFWFVFSKFIELKRKHIYYNNYIISNEMITTLNKILL